MLTSKSLAANSKLLFFVLSITGAAETITTTALTVFVGLTNVSLSGEQCRLQVVNFSQVSNHTFCMFSSDSWKKQTICYVKVRTAPE